MGGVQHSRAVLAAGSFASRKLPHLAFRLVDESQSAMLLLQKVLMADPEVHKTEELLVSGQESASKFLTTSGIAKSLSQAAEMEDAVGVLFSLSWAMQRFGSRKKPLAKVCQRLRQVFSTLAKAAEVRNDAKDMAKTSRSPQRSMQLSVTYYMGLGYHKFAIYACTTKLNGAFGSVP